MGIHTLDIKALRFSCGRFASLIISAVLLSACSSTPSEPENNEITEPAPFEAQSGSIEPVATESADLAPVQTQNIQLAENHPQEYVVKKGDTLWDISAMFLRDPWYWPEIWQRNPQVQNPHLIYPGDILTLVYVNGMPQIQLTRPDGSVTRSEGYDSSGRKYVKLSPSIRRQSLNDAIPSIPADAVRQFLTRPRVITEEEWEDAPYIVGSDDAHLILGAGNKVYVSGELDKERIRYSVFRKGNLLEDPDTGDLLGFEVIYAGEVRINTYGSPSTGDLLSTSREVLIGDRLMSTDKTGIDEKYFPRLPDQMIDGTIISLFDAIASIAKYQIAVINRGSNHGLEVGHLLATYQRGAVARDRFKSSNGADLEVQLPDERSGIMMVFKVFDQVSYGLILKSTRTISKLDRVEKPR
ncbi:Uncharacterized protein with LysM domain, COG1652 [hydrothermal vent metagenome]|uniref:Uncharacterized protein with LysM domain, COG1652 n=1 Tax=hydrothermal vent metagenome TaxID=652676 RepID=A0A3B0YJ30_9ZZZZ